MRHQLRAYKIPDKDLTQDIVAAMMVFAYLARFLPNSLPSQKPIKVHTAAQAERELRSRRVDRRRQL